MQRLGYGRVHDCRKQLRNKCLEEFDKGMAGLAGLQALEKPKHSMANERRHAQGCMHCCNTLIIHLDAACLRPLGHATTSAACNMLKSTAFCSASSRVQAADITASLRGRGQGPADAEPAPIPGTQEGEEGKMHPPPKALDGLDLFNLRMKAKQAGQEVAACAPPELKMCTFKLLPCVT